MTRPLLYRCWDGTQMLPAEDITTAPEYRTWLGHEDRGVLMQHINLNDIHGTPIFEGDYVRRKRPSFKLDGAKNGSVIEEIEVRYVQGSGRNGFNLASSAYCEVIGNKFQGRMTP